MSEEFEDDLVVLQDSVQPEAAHMPDQSELSSQLQGLNAKS